MTGIGGHHSAKARSVEWITPPDIIDALGGPESFDLDPCAAIGQPWPTAKSSFTIKDNGLIQSWHGRVWLNPPYSTSIVGRFLKRLADHGSGTALIFARTDTHNFFNHVWTRATALLFMKTPRLHFHYLDGTRAEDNCGAPTVLCAYGQADAEIIHDCGIRGQFVPLLIPRIVAIAVIEQTWRDVISDAMHRAGGPIPLDELYSAISGHAKARGRRHFREQIRKVLQQGPFERVDRGVWKMKEPQHV